MALNTNHALLLVLGSIGMTAVWAALGVGVGAVVKNQVLAIVGLILWVMLVDPLLQQLLPGVGRFTPTGASDSITGGFAHHLLKPWRVGCFLSPHERGPRLVGTGVAESLGRGHYGFAVPASHQNP